ncbi:hypothetical protein [Rufibacter tibetensis]|uniref:hypothetical protein n=1 Tax=Rufibacter tibetensis TaxID=512763 RepID=UPI00078344B4|nr:hypothetical protein [Rufibacter tibetensis]
MTHEDIIAPACKWLVKEGGCVTAFRVTPGNEEKEQAPYLIGIGSFGRSITLKPYLSRPDFLEDKQTQFHDIPGMDLGQYRFLYAPAGVILEEEVPANWGLLQVNESKDITSVSNPYLPAGGSFWRPGFEDAKIYNLLGENEKLYAACRRFKYNSVLRVEMAF